MQPAFQLGMEWCAPLQLTYAMPSLSLHMCMHPQACLVKEQYNSSGICTACPDLHASLDPGNNPQVPHSIARSVLMSLLYSVHASIWKVMLTLSKHLMVLLTRSACPCRLSMPYVKYSLLESTWVKEIAYLCSYGPAEWAEIMSIMYTCMSAGKHSPAMRCYVLDGTAILYLSRPGRSLMLMLWWVGHRTLVEAPQS
jgi:hypothetical protein